MSHIVEPAVDVLMCVGNRDVDYLMPHSLKSCINNFGLLNNIIIVTCAKAEVLTAINQYEIRSTSARIMVLDDEEVLPATLLGLPGWCKQQVIRLHADLICGTPLVACLSADTIIFKPLTSKHLFSESVPILFYNRYLHTARHLIYERQRVENVARILKVRPLRSWPLGDFIMDFMLFDSMRLRELREYLTALYGDEAFLRILPKKCDTIEQKAAFGEWTLYAVFLLDVLKAKIPVRNSMNRFIAQVHSAKEFAAFHFDAHVVHFVDKSFELSRILAALNGDTAA